MKPGETMTYYSASGWSQGGVADMEAWKGVIAEQEAMVNAPLQVVIK